MEWWDEEWSGASRNDKQAGLWMRARLTVDPSAADLDYKRLVVEYPGGAYSDQALYRLGQAAEARSQGSAAARHFEALAEDYPASRHAAAATEWLARHPAAIAELRSGRESAVAEAPVTEGRGTLEEASAETRDVQSYVDGTGGYAVQLGAFSGVTRARRIADRAEAEGLSVRMVRVPGSELIRVRIGRFENQDDALEAMRRVKADGFDVALVTDAAQEEPIS